MTKNIKKLLAPSSLLPKLDDTRLANFESFVAAFRPVFHRADQSLRFRAYLRGLLEPSERNNVEALAAAAGRVMMVEADLAQALQHFISSSPWDSRRLLAAVRKHTAADRADPHAVWVVHDGVFPKKGQHSVGVQRQFARSVGKKINCQVGVFVVQVGPRGYFPLAGRLYLPQQWLRENQEQSEKSIPEADRGPATKVDIAIGLIQELLGEGERPHGVTAEAGYLSVADFPAALAARDLTMSPPEATAVALRHFEWLKAHLGISHFEGRTWHGWHHHVSLVVTAYHFLAAERISEEMPPFSSPPR